VWDVTISLEELALRSGYSQRKVKNMLKRYASDANALLVLDREDTRVRVRSMHELVIPQALCLPERVSEVVPISSLLSHLAKRYEEHKQARYEEAPELKKALEELAKL